MGMLVPNAPRPVMWNRFFAGLLLLFCQVVEEEVDQDCVDFGFWLQLDDLASKLLNGPDTASCAAMSVGPTNGGCESHLVSASPMGGLAV
jgi:hypothetical protein